MSKIILDYLNVSIPEGADSWIKFTFGVLIISIVLLTTIINLVGSLITIVLIKIYDVKNKVNNKFISKIIKTFEGTTWFWIIFETLLCIICLLMLISSSFLTLKSFI